MAQRSITLDGQDRDGDFVERLRELQRQHQAGQINAADFDQAYRALDREAGTLCRCKRGVQTVRGAHGSVCAVCYLDHLEGR